ncbi:MAG: isoleucine--tRNA ligase, partial [Actinomycetota bacterium]
LAQIHSKGLLVQDYRVAPYCPRCGTGLSDHELAQGYESVTDPSVYLRFPVIDGELKDLGASLLVWTTTPWTLVSNTAIAVNPAVDYLVVRTNADPENEIISEVLVIAKNLVALLGSGYEILRELKGSQLEKVKYQPPFNYVD